MSLDAMKQMAIDAGLQYVKDKPAEAFLMLLLRTPVKGYLFNTLPEEMLQWYSADIDKDPLGLVKYLQSEQGKEVVRAVFNQYKQSKGN